MITAAQGKHDDGIPCRKPDNTGQPSDDWAGDWFVKGGNYKHLELENAFLRKRTVKKSIRRFNCKVCMVPVETKGSHGFHCKRCALYINNYDKRQNYFRYKDGENRKPGPCKNCGEPTITADRCDACYRADWDKLHPINA